MEKKNLNFTEIYKDTNKSEKIVRDCEVNSKTFYSRLLTDNSNDGVKK